jgi:hypothetical protein
VKRSLHLRAEVLTELSTEEMRGVLGGAETTFACSRYQCPSLDYCDPLPTLPVRVCIKN